MIHRATTPNQSFTFPIDVSEMTEIQITYCQSGQVILEKTKSDLSFSDDGKTASFVMSQEEANLFSRGSMAVQARLLSSEGECLASDVVHLLVYDVLHDNVLSEGGE